MADTGYSATFAIDGGSTVAEVTAIQVPGFSREAVETTHLESANAYKEFIAGLKEMSECTFTLNWTPSATDAMITAFEAETAAYEITAPNGVRIQFSGFFTVYTPPNMTPGEKMEATVTIKPTGKATFAAAA